MHRRAVVPARVNIIGEHVDNHGGLSLPFATSDFLVWMQLREKRGILGMNELSVCGKRRGAGQQTWQSTAGYPLERACPLRQRYV